MRFTFLRASVGIFLLRIARTSSSKISLPVCSRIFSAWFVVDSFCSSCIRYGIALFSHFSIRLLHCFVPAMCFICGITRGPICKMACSATLRSVLSWLFSKSASGFTPSFPRRLRILSTSAQIIGLLFVNCCERAGITSGSISLQTAIKLGIPTSKCTAVSSMTGTAFGPIFSNMFTATSLLILSFPPSVFVRSATHALLSSVELKSTKPW